MITLTNERDRAVVAYAREIVAEVAPGQLPDFPTNAEIYLADSGAARRSVTGHRDVVQGAGIPEWEIVISYVAMYIGQRVLDEATGVPINKVIERMLKWRPRRARVYKDEAGLIERGAAIAAIEKAVAEWGLTGEPAAQIVDAAVRHMPTGK